MTTKQEQILLHLYGQLVYGNTYEMPYETTQNGIADAVGISRGHVSIEMKKLETKGLVYRLERHVRKDGIVRRNNSRCYRLNALGIMVTQDLMRSMEAMS